jgi:hypothetical protein
MELDSVGCNKNTTHAPSLSKRGVQKKVVSNEWLGQDTKLIPP